MNLKTLKTILYNVSTKFLFLESLMRPDPSLTTFYKSLSSTVQTATVQSMCTGSPKNAISIVQKFIHETVNRAARSKWHARSNFVKTQQTCACVRIHLAPGSIYPVKNEWYRPTGSRRRHLLRAAAMWAPPQGWPSRQPQLLRSWRAHHKTSPSSSFHPTIPTSSSSCILLEFHHIPFGSPTEQIACELLLRSSSRLGFS
jgi:hypothetical protein